MRTKSFFGFRSLLGMTLATGLVWVVAADDASGQRTTPGGTTKSSQTTQSQNHHDFPHIHAALHGLRNARQELHEAKHDFGGRREQALRAVDQAIHELDNILEHPPQNNNGGTTGSANSPSIKKKKGS